MGKKWPTFAHFLLSGCLPHESNSCAPTASEPNCVFFLWFLVVVVDLFNLIQVISLCSITYTINAPTHIAGISLAEGTSRTGLSVPHGGAPSDNHMASPSPLKSPSWLAEWGVCHTSPSFLLWAFKSVPVGHVGGDMKFILGLGLSPEVAGDRARFVNKENYEPFWCPD